MLTQQSARRVCEASEQECPQTRLYAEINKTARELHVAERTGKLKLAAKIAEHLYNLERKL